MDLCTHWCVCCRTRRIYLNFSCKAENFTHFAEQLRTYIDSEVIVLEYLASEALSICAGDFPINDCWHRNFAYRDTQFEYAF